MLSLLVWHWDVEAVWCIPLGNPQCPSIPLWTSGPLLFASQSAFSNQIETVWDGLQWFSKHTHEANNLLHRVAVGDSLARPVSPAELHMSHISSLLHGRKWSVTWCQIEIGLSISVALIMVDGTAASIACSMLVASNLTENRGLRISFFVMICSLNLQGYMEESVTSFEQAGNLARLREDIWGVYSRIQAKLTVMEFYIW